MDYLEPPTRDGDQPAEILPLSRILLFAFSEDAMAASALPIILFTLIWGAVAASGYWVPQGPHKQLIQVGSPVLLTWICCLTKVLRAGMLDLDWSLLLAVLAVLLHEPDEPPDRPNHTSQHRCCHPLFLGQLHAS